MLVELITPTDRLVFRGALSHYPTGVCVISSMDGGGVAMGMVVGTFTSVSLDPPLVAFLPSRDSRTWPRIRDTGRFCVNVLAHDQLSICRRFASPGEDKFEGVTHVMSANGSPVLADVAAWIDCDIQSVTTAGDHYIVVGLVRSLHADRERRPLLFLKGAYGQFEQVDG